MNSGRKTTHIPPISQQDVIELDRRALQQIIRQRRVIHRQAIFIWVQIGVIAALCVELYLRVWH